MNILLLNTYAHGGAGVACARLQAALRESGAKADLLSAADLPGKWPFYAERLSFLPYERDKSVRFSFSLANFGHDITSHPLVQKADVLHLHWINQGFLSLRNIQALANLGKPMVWTLHDMWAFTGGCHYAQGCDHFQQSCGHCPFLRSPSGHDLSRRIWLRKQQFFPKNLHFVTCSAWLAGVAKTSGLLREYPIADIPNPIDTEVFKPLDDAKRRQFRAELGISPDAKVLLFVAMKVSEPRKGFQYLQESLGLLKEKNPYIPLEIIVLGQAESDSLVGLPYPVHPQGMVRDAALLSKIYGAADVFVTPSLEDNLPNTVMESLACGTPVVAFATGGIPEMVEHGVQGFIAPQKDAAGLAEGIARLLADQTLLDRMRVSAREKALREYANPVVAERYLQLYQNLIKNAEHV